MKRLLLLLVLAVSILAAAFVAPILLDEPGHVALDVGQWRIEMTLLTLVGLVVLAWIALSLLMAFLRMPGRALKRARDYQARRQMEQGLLALSEGDWEGAERSLARSLSRQPSTAGFLAAARAAQGQSDRASRDRWLKLADGRFGRRRFITGLARARLMLDDGQTAEAVQALEDLHLSRPRHSGVLRLLLQSYQDESRWRDVRLLAPAMKKAGMLDADKMESLQRLAACRELDATIDGAGLEQAFQALPRRWRRDREIGLAYARRAAELGQGRLAQPVLRRLIKDTADSEALEVFVRADEGDRAARIADCEKWLQAEPDNLALQKTLGLLYLEDRQYEKAAERLENVARQRPDGEVYAALGRVHDRAGDLEAAARCYRQALRWRDDRTLPPLPAPGANDPDS